MSDEAMASRYALAAGDMLKGSGLQQATKDRARKFLMLALDHLT